jgi:phosphonate transport system substrate-binding protein
MHEDPKGKQILGELMINRFTEAQDDWYDSIRQMELKVASLVK